MGRHSSVKLFIQSVLLGCILATSSVIGRSASLSPDDPGISGVISDLETGAEWFEGSLPGEAFQRFQSWTDLYLQNQSDASRAALLPSGLEAAKGWRNAMLELIQTDPQEAIRRAVPDEIRRVLPTSIQELIERPVSGLGDLLTAIIEDADQMAERTLRTAHVEGETFDAFVYGRRAARCSKYGIPLHGIAVGDKLAVHVAILAPIEEAAGSTINASIGQTAVTFPSRAALLRAESALRSYEDNHGPILRLESYIDVINGRTVAADSSPAWTTGEKKVLVVQADFPDQPGPPKDMFGAVITTSQIQAVMDTKVTPFYATSSYGKVSFKTTVLSKIYRCSQNSSAYLTSPMKVVDELKKLVAADVDVSSYDRIIGITTDLEFDVGAISVPAGLATLGGSQVLLNGNIDEGVIEHELGHNFGLEHANLWETTDDNPLSNAGQSAEYGDGRDIMGSSSTSARDFNGRSKLMLHWVTDGVEVKTVTTSQRVRIYSAERTNQEPHEPWLVGVSIKRDAANDYWLIYRRSVYDFDKIGDGLCLLKCPHAFGGPSLLIDFALGTERALPIGEAVTDPNANVSLKVVGKGGVSPNEYIDVDIVFGDFPPVVRMDSPDQVIAAGNSTTLAAGIAAGNPRPSVRWQRRPAGSSEWKDLQDASTVVGSNAEKLVLKDVPPSWSGDAFRFIATNSAGTATSPSATLKVTTTGTFTLLGTAQKSGRLDGSGFGVRLSYPESLCVTPGGTLYVADDRTLRKCTLTGTASQIAPAAGVLTSSEMGMPTALAAKNESELYVASSGAIAKFTSTGSITRIAGTDQFDRTVDGQGASARFSRISGLVYEANSDQLYCIESSGAVVRRITLDGQVTTIAGKPGERGYKNGRGPEARFDWPQSMTLADDGSLYVADTYNLVIRKVTPNGDVSTFSGVWDGTNPNGLGRSAHTRDGPPNVAQYMAPTGILFDRQRRCFYVADGNRIRVLDMFGNVTTIAGTGDWRDVDGPPSQAAFGFSNFTVGMAMDPSGILYVTTAPSHTVRGLFVDAPVIHRAPSYVALDSVGQAVVSLDISGSGILHYDWWRDGQFLGTTAEPRLLVGTAGSYVVVASNGSGLVTSSPVTVGAPGQGELTNISTRSLISNGENIQIAGFVIGGSGKKRVLIRASGPALAQFSVPQTLADPVLSLYDGNVLRAENDDWTPDQAGAFTQAGAFAWAPGSKDAALVMDLAPGGYTAQVRGKNGQSGVGLIEVYELDYGASAARLVNISTRAIAGAGEETLIAGFIVKGTRRVLIRASGPALRQFGLTQTLSDPKLTVYAGQSVVATNDNWDAPLENDFNQVHAFSWEKGSKDAAVVLSLPEGAYTAHVSSVDGQKGIALIEVYEFP